jgi:3-deoxy-D-manno-octulosonic-acid transferase
LFRKECAEQLHKTFTPLSPKQWNEISTRIVNNAINQEPPFDMQEDAQMYLALSDFLVNRAQNDPMVLESDDGVFINEETKTMHFKIAGFKTFLIHKGLAEKSISLWKIGNILNNIRVQTDEVNMQTGESVKRTVNVGAENIRAHNKVYYTRTVSTEDLVFLDSAKKLLEGVI